MNWDVVEKLASGVEKTTATSISPYFFHLYSAQEVLVGRETIAYNDGKDILKYNVEPNLEPELEESELDKSEANPIEV